MKRLNKVIIVLIVFVLSFSIVASAAAYDNPVNLFDSDPTYFDLTEDEQNEFPDLICNGKICIEYTKDKGYDSEKRVRSYCAVYSTYKNFAAYMFQEETSNGEMLDYLQYNYEIGDELYIKWGSDLNGNNKFVKLIDNCRGNLYRSHRGFCYSYTYSGNTTKSNAGNNAYDIEIISTDFPIFQNENDYNTYREYGIINNALYNPTPKDYSNELYFKSFEVIPHVFNKPEAYYFDIKYELSDYAKKHLKNLNLNFQNKYQIEFSNINGAFITTADTNWFSKSISLADNPYGFTISLIDLPSYEYAVSYSGFNVDSKAILGYEGFVIETFNDVLQKYVGDVTAATVSGSYLYFKFNLRFNDSSGCVIGKRNDFTYDFLTKETKSSLYVPDTTTDSSGNTTFVKDTDGNISYTQEGDTKINKDYYSQEGDKYYYTDNNGSKKEITENDYNNSSANVDIDINIGNGSGEYININPVDFNQFIKGMKNMLEEFDTKGGLFLLIKDVFAMFPSEITVIVVGAISAITIVSIICILRR